MILQVGVKVFLRSQEGNYLLLRRSSERYPDTRGTWDIPGGRIHPGSRLMENLAREVHEETKLSIDPTFEPILLAAQDIILPSGERHVVRLTYFAHTIAGEPVLDAGEHVAYRWLSLQELETHADMDAYAGELINKGLLRQFEK